MENIPSKRWKVPASPDVESMRWKQGVISRQPMKSPDCASEFTKASRL